MNKMTPGPWHIQRYRNRHNIHIETTGFIGTKIARIEQREEQLANAQAIAALPELVEALEGFVFLERTNMTKKQVQLRIDIAKQALAKVEGKE